MRILLVTLCWKFVGIRLATIACAGADLEKYSAAGTVIAGFHRWNRASDHLQRLDPSLTCLSNCKNLDVLGSPDCK